MIVKIIGLIIIAASFVFILKSPDKSLMDRLMERKRTAQPQDAEGEQEKPAEDAAVSETSEK